MVFQLHMAQNLTVMYGNKQKYHLQCCLRRTYTVERVVEFVTNPGKRLENTLGLDDWNVY